MTTQRDNHLSVSEDEEARVGRVSLARYVWVWLVLSSLTLALYAGSRFPLGAVGVFISLGIALVKATLVALFFMHLWDERGAIPFALVVSASLLLLLLGFTVTDV